jgi:hypothetical protein
MCGECFTPLAIGSEQTGWICLDGRIWYFNVAKRQFSFTAASGINIGPTRAAMEGVLSLMSLIGIRSYKRIFSEIKKTNGG